LLFPKKKKEELRFEESSWRNDQKMHNFKVVNPLQKQITTIQTHSIDPCVIEKIFQARKDARNEQGLENGCAPFMRPKT